MEQPILNLMPDDRKAKSVGFLFFIVPNVLVYGMLRINKQELSN